MAEKDLHPDVKKVLIRKHIAASTVGILSLCIALVVNIAIGYDWGNWFEDMENYGILIRLAFSIAFIGIYASVLFLIFNKRGYEAEVQGGIRYTIPTIMVLADLAITFSFSIYLLFSSSVNSYHGDNQDALHRDLLCFFVSFGLSVMLMIISEFMLFHAKSHKSKIYTDD